MSERPRNLVASKDPSTATTAKCGIRSFKGLMAGTPKGYPGHETREAAEEAALAGLAILGRKAVPAGDYEPFADSDSHILIVLNDRSAVVPVWPQEMVEELLGILDEHSDRSIAKKAVRLADKLAMDFDPNNKDDLISLAILGNCRWTHVSRVIVDEFCAAHGIDL